MGSCSISWPAPRELHKYLDHLGKIGIPWTMSTLVRLGSSHLAMPQRGLHKPLPCGFLTKVSTFYMGFGAYRSKNLQQEDGFGLRRRLMGPCRALLG